MTQVYVIIGIIILVCVLVCYIFVRQTVIKRKKEKRRLQRALEKRSKELVQMLNAFPPNFLPNDLTLFIYRCIVDVFEQLSKLAPEKEEYLENLTLYSTQMESTARTPKNETETSIQSGSQINELRQYLNYLGRFLQKWVQMGNITSKQYAHYKGLLKNLITKLMLENYSLSAKAAVDIEKHKLAVHYYTLAKNLITKEGLAALYKEKLSVINKEVAVLDKIIRTEEERQEELAKQEAAKTEQTASSESSEQWEQFKEEADWKKKNIYD